ncbi:MAG TPA: LysR substrate-binding domain-containing protein, partial [Bradyrhizobium sp.]|nr:LysR substrate-binding domain-containing protein [Bradyrhizobium sp.]
DLDRAPLIHFEWHRPDPVSPTWAAWFRAAGLVASEPRSQLKFSDESHAIQAAVAGQGVALLSLSLVEDELAAGRLVQPFGPVVEGLTYRMLTVADRPMSPVVTAAADWLRAEIAAIRSTALKKPARIRRNPPSRAR